MADNWYDVAMGYKQLATDYKEKFDQAMALVGSYKELMAVKDLYIQVLETKAPVLVDEEHCCDE